MLAARHGGGGLLPGDGLRGLLAVDGLRLLRIPPVAHLLRVARAAMLAAAWAGNGFGRLLAWDGLRGLLAQGSLGRCGRLRGLFRHGSRALALRLGALLLAYVARGGGVRTFGGIELHAFQIGTLRGVLACRGSGMFVVVHPTYYSEVARSRPTLRSIFTAQAPLRCHAVARTVRQPFVPFALPHRAAFVSKTPALATEKPSFIPSTRYFVAFGQNVRGGGSSLLHII